MNSEETNPVALQAALQQAEILLAAKDRELTAKEEIITLLREKIRELERAPREEYDFMAALRGQESGQARPKATQRPVTRAAEEAPKSLWARFYQWFREA